LVINGNSGKTLCRINPVSSVPISIKNFARVLVNSLLLTQFSNVFKKINPIIRILVSVCDFKIYFRIYRLSVIQLFDEIIQKTAKEDFTMLKYSYCYEIKSGGIMV
jgi:hypothetical protein